MSSQLKTLLCAALCVTCFACNNNAQKSETPSTETVTQPNVQKKPHILVEEPNFYGGTVSEGEIVTHRYVVKNTGDAPLNIKNVSTSCGCTAANAGEKVVQPGGETYIEASLDTAHRHGRVIKTINIDTDDPDKPRSTLSIGAEIQVLVAFKTAVVRPQNLQKGEPWTEEFEITALDPENLNLGEITTSLEGMKASVEKREVEGQTKIFCKVEYTPTEIGPLRAMVAIDTNLEPTPSIRLTIQGQVQGIIAATPLRVIIREHNENSGVQLASSQDGFKILKIENADGLLDAAVVAGVDDKHYQINITTTEKAKSQETFQSSLIVKTDMAKMDTVEIPVFFRPSLKGLSKEKALDKTKLRLPEKNLKLKEFHRKDVEKMEKKATGSVSTKAPAEYQGK